MPHREHPLGWPSVTEILGDYDKGWLKYFYKKYGSVEKAEAYSKSRAAVGDRCHLGLEALLNGYGADVARNLVQDDEKQAIHELGQRIALLGVESVGSERSVECKEFQYHGSLDGLLKLHNPSTLPSTDFLGAPVVVEPGILCIGDLKTKEDGKPLKKSEMKKHAMQMAAYAKAVEEEDGIFPDLGIIFQLDIPTAKVTLHCAYPLKRFLKPFLLQREQFDYIHGKATWKHTRTRDNEKDFV